MTEPVNSKQAANCRVAMMAASLVATMVGLSFASAPLYDLFCKTTGFGGTTQRADAAPSIAGTNRISVRFDANSAAELGWEFHPVQQKMTVKIGDQAMAHYEATNLGSTTITGTAVFNVTPPEAGVFFNKIQCFCFTEQTLKPGEKVDMPVVYFIDPEILEDADTKAIREITLSYTFYPVKNPAAPKAASLQQN